MVDPEPIMVDPARPRVQAPIGSRRLIRSGAFIFTMNAVGRLATFADDNRRSHGCRSRLRVVRLRRRVCSSSPYRRPRVGRDHDARDFADEMRIAMGGSSERLRREELLHVVGHCRGG